jgi:hypothetical protein
LSGTYSGEAPADNLAGMAQAAQTWAAKDPDATLDYLYTIPLDSSDAVATYDFVLVSGDVVIDSHSLDPEIVANDDVARGQTVTAWLSGGTDGTESVFRLSWTTTGGRENERIIALPVIANVEAGPVLTGYAMPAPDHLVIRYPEFAAVDRSTIQTWLNDALRMVSSAWSEADYAAGIMAYAAHHLALSGFGTNAESTSDLPPGITSMKIGTLALSFDAALTKAKAEGTWGATRYGVEFRRLLRANVGGPRVGRTGSLPYDPLRYPHGEA